VAGNIQDIKYLFKLLELRYSLGLINRVYIIGTVDEIVKKNLYKVTNVVVILSLSDIFEAYSIVAIEVWLYREAYCSFPVGALRYRIINGVNGLLAVKKSPEALAEAVLKSLELRDIPQFKTYSNTTDKLVKMYRWLVK